MLELTKCRITSPIESKHMRNIWMLMPSSPQAEEPFIPKMTPRSPDSDNGTSLSAQAPTRGRRHATSGTSPNSATSPATRGPTLTDIAWAMSMLLGMALIILFKPVITTTKIVVGAIQVHRVQSQFEVGSILHPYLLTYSSAVAS